MAVVVKLGQGDGKRPEPKQKEAAKNARKTGAPAGEGFNLNSPVVAIIAGVVILIVVAGGLWMAFGQQSAPMAAGPGADQQGVYAPPEMTGQPAPGAAKAAAGGNDAQGVYAPPEVTGGGGMPGAGAAQGVYAPPEVTGAGR